MCYNNQGINFSYIKCHKSTTNFFPSILAMSLPQFFGCHNFFFLPFSATWLPQFIFSLSSLPYNSDNLVATIGFPLGSKNFNNLIIKIQFFSLLHHITYLPSFSYFFLQFQHRCCRNSPSFLIFPNKFKQ